MYITSLLTQSTRMCMNLWHASALLLPCFLHSFNFFFVPFANLVFFFILISTPWNCIELCRRTKAIRVYFVINLYNNFSASWLRLRLHCISFDSFFSHSSARWIEWHSVLNDTQCNAKHTHTLFNATHHTAKSSFHYQIV